MAGPAPGYEGWPTSTPTPWPGTGTVLGFLAFAAVVAIAAIAITYKRITGTWSKPWGREAIASVSCSAGGFRDCNGSLVTQNMGWRAWPARRVGCRRYPASRWQRRRRRWRRSRRLGVGRRQHDPAATLDPLVGGAGGSKRTARTRDERSGLDELRLAVLLLTQRMDQLQPRAARPRRGRADPRGEGPRGRRRKRQRSSLADDELAEEAIPERQPDSLWQRLSALFLRASTGAPPSDEVTRAALQRFLQMNPPDEGRPAAAPPAGRPAKKERGTSTASAAQTLAEATAGPVTVDRTLPPPPRPLVGSATLTRWRTSPRLHPGQWDCRVLTPQQFQNDALVLPAAIASNSQDEINGMKRWYGARGSTTGITIVDTTAKDSGSKFLLTSTVGPQLCAATVHHLGNGAPRPRSLPGEIKDDNPMPTQQAAALCLCRLTLSREFAAQELTARAMRHPQCLPALLLPSDLLSHVISTRGAISYPNEATCLILIAVADLTAMCAAPMPLGAFIMPHRGASKPQWLARPPEATSAQYWVRAAEQCTALGAHMAFRTGGTACLGLVGASAFSPLAVSPRWCIRGCPPAWNDKNLEAWILQRGFLRIQNLQRRGRNIWVCQAVAPTGPVGTTSFVFSSGISIVPAVGRQRTVTAAATAAPSRWGAPTLPCGPDATTSSAAQEVPRLVTEAGPPEQNGDAMAVDLPGAHAAPPLQASPCGLRRRISVAEMPYLDRFDVVDCGGDGDCGFTSCGRSLYHHRSALRVKGLSAHVDNTDFLPRGAVQAELRMLVAAEIRRNWDRYLFTHAPDAIQYAERIGQAGQWADSRSMCALAQAAQAQVRIWAWSADFQRWSFYIFSPWKAKAKLNPSTIWLRLRDEHYSWLRPKAGFSDEEEHDLFRTAVSKPDSLLGAGRVRLGAALGLPMTSSMSSCPASAGARRALPLAGTATDRQTRTVADVALGGHRKRSRTARTLSSQDQALSLTSLRKATNYTVNKLYVCPCAWDPAGGSAPNGMAAPAPPLFAPTGDAVRALPCRPAPQPSAACALPGLLHNLPRRTNRSMHIA